MKYISAWTLALRPVFSTRELDCYSMQDVVLLDLKLFFISPPLSGKKRIGLRCRYLGDSCFTSELHLTVSTFPSAQNQSRCDRILFGCHRGLWGFIRSSLAASKQASEPFCLQLTLPVQVCGSRVADSDTCRTEPCPT